MTVIGSQTFMNCKKLTSIAIPSSVKSIDSEAFNGCVNLTSVDISNGVTSIGELAFKSCGLTSIVFPESVTSIGTFVIYDCLSISSITLLNATPPAVEGYSFWINLEGDYPQVLYVPYGSKEAYASHEIWGKFANIVELAPPVYNLIYIVDGEEYKTYTLEYGATITPEPQPTKEGYMFSGWSEIPATMPANHVIVTGTFTAIVDIDAVKTDTDNADGKYIENNQIVIYRNGVKYDVNGAVVK